MLLQDIVAGWGLRVLMGRTGRALSRGWGTWVLIGSDGEKLALSRGGVLGF